MQRLAVAGLAAELEAGRGDGSVRDGDAETLARGIELIARGFVLARDPGPGRLGRARARRRRVPAAMSGASLNAARRAAELDALAAGEAVDLVVVGGGITGAGVALDAASRGLSVALLERRDLAHGTSRWSSKLVHGGLRYLEHREWGLAWESARERALLMGTIAPHLVRAAAVRDAARRRHAGRARRRRRTIGLRIGDGLRIGARTSRARAPAGAPDQRARGAPARARAGRGPACAARC